MNFVQFSSNNYNGLKKTDPQSERVAYFRDETSLVQPPKLNKKVSFVPLNFKEQLKLILEFFFFF